MYRFCHQAPPTKDHIRDRQLEHHRIYLILEADPKYLLKETIQHARKISKRRFNND